MGADVTTLGMAVDSTGVVRATDALDRLTEAANRAAGAVTGTEGSMTQSVVVGSQLDRAITKTVETVFRLAEGFIQLGIGVGRYQDIAEKTGSTDPAGLASLRTAADVAGTSVDSVAMAINRMALSLSRSDSDDRGAGKALERINLNIAEFKKLDPVTQYRTLAGALDKFADSQAKVQIVQAITGRGGAEQLVMLKELAQERVRENLLTNEQIALADKLADASARSRSKMLQTAELLAVQMLPAVDAVAGATKDLIVEMLGLDTATGKLKNSTAVQEFAFSAVQYFSYVADASSGVVRVIEVLWTALTANAQIHRQLFTLDIEGAVQTAKKAREDIMQSLDAPLFGERLRTNMARVRAEMAAAAADAASGAKDKPQLDPFTAGNDKATRVREQRDEYAELVRTLSEKVLLERQESELGRDLTEGEKERLSVYDRINKFKKAITDQQLTLVDSMLEEREALRTTNKQREEEAKWLAESNRENAVRLEKERQRAEISERLAESAEEELQSYGKTDEALREVEARRLRDAAAAMRQKIAYDDFNQGQQELNALYAQQADALDRAAESQERLVRAQRNSRTSGTEGAMRAIDSYRQRTEDLGSAVEDVTSRSLGDLEDALVSVAMTGELSWKRLIDNMIQEALRLAVIRPLLNSLFSGASGWLSGLGGGGSSIGASSASFDTNALTNPIGKASGGDVDPFSVHEVNERGFETLSTKGKTYLMMGDSAGKVSPAGAAGGTTVHLTYAPVTNIDARSDQAQIAVSMARVNRANNEELVQQLKSMGVIQQ